MVHEKDENIKLDQALFKKIISSKNTNKHFNYWELIGENIKDEELILCTKLFWPDFIEFDGCIFLKERFSEKVYKQWKNELGDNKQAIEKTMNHVHVYDLFSNKIPLDDIYYSYFGQVLREMWEHRIKLLFSDRLFEVSLDYEEDELIINVSRI